MINAAKSKISSCVRWWFGIILGTERSQRTTPSKVWAWRFAIAENVGTPDRPVWSSGRAPMWQLAQRLWVKARPPSTFWLLAGCPDKPMTHPTATASLCTMPVFALVYECVS